MSTEESLKPGDVVRVKDVSGFLVALANKIRDRDAEVIWVGPTAVDMFKGYACVKFKKRNGRGQEFQEVMRISDLVLQGDSTEAVNAS